MSSYIYKGEPKAIASGPLPAGDYSFVVAGIDEPYEKNEHFILSVKLTIQPSGLTVFANPWAGYDRNGEKRDGIAEFLLAVNRAPKVGEIPDWDSIPGARGKCKLKIELATQGALAGKEVNKVAYFYRPKELKEPVSGTASPQKQTISADLEHEPDDIPF